MIYTLAETFDIQRSPQTPTLWPGALMLVGNARAHLWQVTLLDAGVPVDLTGATATAKFRRAADGVTVVQSAQASGNVVSVQLDPACYRYAGRLKAMLEITVGSGEEAVTATAKLTYFDVLEGAGDSLSDPENVIPSIGEIIAQMDAVETATQNAELAADNANEAADDAEAMAGQAEDAAAAIDGMTVEAQTVAPGGAATASVSTVAGHKHVVLGIPQGVQGERGSLPWDGTAITGTSSVPTAYPTGLAAVNAGDIYRYTGIDSANAGNEYLCALGGDAATALWVYSRNSRGVPGAGNVSYVDELPPDGDGNVALGALRYNAAMTLTAGEKLQARANAGAQALISVTGLAKFNGAGDASSAVAGTDYRAAQAEAAGTLAAASWTGTAAPYSQTVAVAGLLATSTGVDVGLASTATQAQREAARAALLMATAYADDTVTVVADGELPTVDLPMIVRRDS